MTTVFNRQLFLLDRYSVSIFLTIILSILSVYTYSQREFEPTGDSSLAQVEMFYIFTDTLTNKPDSHLIETRYYNMGHLTKTESQGQNGYTFISEFTFYPGTSNIRNTISRTLFQGHDSAISYSYYEYDRNGKEYFVSNYDSSSTRQQMLFDFYHYLYDSLDRITTKYSVSTKSETYFLSGSTEYEYDKYGNITKQLDWNHLVNERRPVQNIYTYEYDKNGRILSEQNKGITFSTDFAGNFLKEITETGGLTKYEYNDNGQLTREIFYIDFSEESIKNVGQTYQKNVREYFYYPNGLIRLKRELMTIDKYGVEKTSEYKAYYKYKI